MKLIDAQQKLLSLNSPIIETSDAAACLNISIVHASKILTRLVDAKVFIKLSKGKWATEKVDPLVLPEYLTAPFPSYISLQSALYHHGLISQVPAVVYAVSLARTKRYKTPLGTISVHHFLPNLFFGFDYIPKTTIKIASPEKALFDTLYLYPSRTLLFKALPEIELPKNFDVKKILKWTNNISSKQRAGIIKKRLNDILSSS